MESDKTRESILLVKNSNDKNYVIENNQNRFSEGLYTISKKNYSALVIQWNDNISNISLVHEYEKKKNNISINVYQ
jgi:hypothetical protein